MPENLIDIFDQGPHSVGGVMSQKGKKSWLVSQDGVYSSIQGSKITNKLKPGIYFAFQDGKGGCHAQSFDIECDELYEITNEEIQKLNEEFDTFWKKKDVFKKYNIKHKRGILLYGPPGTGKTSQINMLCNSLVARGGLVFHISNEMDLFSYTLFVHEHLRAVEPERDIIVVIEDVDKYLSNDEPETALLSLLDGTESVDHQVVIATTNRFDELNDLILRPSRLDIQIEVGPPDEETRKLYLINKGIEEKDIEKWVKDTDGFSMAALKELFSAVILLELDYDVVMQRIRSQADLVSETTYKKPKSKSSRVGFKTA